LRRAAAELSNAPTGSRSHRAGRATAAQAGLLGGYAEYLAELPAEVALGDGPRLGPGMCVAGCDPVAGVSLDRRERAVRAALEFLAGESTLDETEPGRGPCGVHGEPARGPRAPHRTVAARSPSAPPDTTLTTLGMASIGTSRRTRQSGLPDGGAASALTGSRQDGNCRSPDPIADERKSIKVTPTDLAIYV